MNRRMRKGEETANRKIRNICANKKSKNDRKCGCNERARRIEDVNTSKRMKRRLRKRIVKDTNKEMRRKMRHRERKRRLDLDGERREPFPTKWSIHLC